MSGSVFISFMFQESAYKSAGTKNALLYHFSIAVLNSIFNSDFQQCAVVRTTWEALLIQMATNCLTWQTTKQLCSPVSEKEGASRHALSSCQPLMRLARFGRIQRKVFSLNWKKLEAGKVPECCGCSSLPMVFSPSHWGDELDHSLITSFCIVLLQCESSTGCLLGARRIF